MSIYAATIEKMETQLNEWNAQIQLLHTKLESAGTGLKLQRAREINELRAKQRAARAKLEEMKKSSNEAWEQVKGTADKVWDDLKTGIAKAHSNIAL